jgi:hypothetical protein
MRGGDSVRTATRSGITLYCSGGHQVIDPPVLPDAGKGRVYLPPWNLHHSLGSLVVGACFDIGQPFPLSSP